MINSGSINTNTINTDWDTGVAVTETVSEVAVITSSISATAIVLDVPEAAVITSGYLGLRSDLVSEVAVISATAYPSATRIQDVAEEAVIVSAVSLVNNTQEDIAETAVITSTSTESYPAVDITETAVVTSQVTYSTAGVLDVLETAVITSSVGTVLLEDVSETAVITSNVSFADARTLDVSETAVITSATVLLSAAIEDVSETAVIMSDTVSVLSAITDVAEEGFISSEVVIDGSDVWTANTVNWAMSTYTGLTLTSATARYAVSEEGLWSVASTFANMNMSSGHSDVGSPNLKNVPYVYAYMEHDAPLDISVTADVLGMERTQTYTQMARTAADTRAVRCTLGRGFRSSYYKLNFTSSGYARVRECLPIVTELSRRI